MMTELGDDISESQISYWKKDEMRNKLKALKKTVDDRDKAKKAAVMTEIVETAKALCNANKEVWSVNPLAVGLNKPVSSHFCLLPYHHHPSLIECRR